MDNNNNGRRTGGGYFSDLTSGGAGADRRGTGNGRRSDMTRGSLGGRSTGGGYFSDLSSGSGYGMSSRRSTRGASAEGTSHTRGGGTKKKRLTQGDGKKNRAKKGNKKRHKFFKANGGIFCAVPHTGKAGAFSCAVHCNDACAYRQNCILENNKGHRI